MPTFSPTDGRGRLDLAIENASYMRQKRFAQPNQFTTVLPDPAWDAVFGGLERTRQQAEDAGLNYRVNWGGFGREGTMPAARGSLNPLEERAAIDAFRSRAASAASDEQQIAKAQQKAYNDARQAQLLGELRSDYDEQQLGQAFALPEEPSLTTRTPGAPGQAETVRVERDPAAGPLSDRERQYRQAPPNLRPALLKQFAEMDAKAQQGEAAMIKARADETTAQAALKKAGAPPEKRPITETAEAGLISKLASQWTTASKDYADMDRAARIMKVGLDRFDADPNGASQAVLVTFQKLLDPTSVVRESEYDRSAAGISMKARIQGYMNRLASGGAGVPKGELSEMVKTAEQFLEKTKDAPASAKKRISGMAERYQIPPELIFSGPDPTAGATSGKVTIKSITEVK